MERWIVIGLRSYLLGGPEGLKPRLSNIIGMFLSPPFAPFLRQNERHIDATSGFLEHWIYRCELLNVRK